MKFQVTYKRQKYDIDIKDGSFVLWKKMLLFLRRIKRFSIRAWKAFYKEASIACIFIIFYIVVVIITEINIMDKDILDILWSIKQEIFTVFVLVFAEAIINSERNWKREIKKLYCIYVDFRQELENDIVELCKTLNINIKNQDFFYTIETLKRLQDEIDDVNIEKVKYKKENVKYITERLKDARMNLVKELEKIDCIDNEEYIIHNISNNTYDLIEFEREIDIGKKIYILKEICWNTFFLICESRSIWRREINIDREIIEKLYKHNKEKIEEDYYFMLLRYKN